jgi:hypothetical protein
MAAVISLLVIITLSILATRVATVALTLTGLSRESARFQSRSALSGTGFTTAESESVVNHPVRRRILLILMLVGNAGIVTAVASLLLSFSGARSTGAGLIRAAVLFGGLAVLWLVARSRLADRWLSRIIERALHRFTRVDVQDYASLLRLARDWIVAELEVDAGDWMADKTLAEMDLAEEGIIVLGIERAGGRYVGAPKGNARVHVGDVLVAYGSRERLDSLDTRPLGEPGDADRQRCETLFDEKVAQQQAEEAAKGEAST